MLSSTPTKCSDRNAAPNNTENPISPRARRSCVRGVSYFENPNFSVGRDWMRFASDHAESTPRARSTSLHVPNRWRVSNASSFGNVVAMPVKHLNLRCIGIGTRGQSGAKSRGWRYITTGKSRWLNCANPRSISQSGSTRMYPPPEKQIPRPATRMTPSGSSGITRPDGVARKRCGASSHG